MSEPTIICVLGMHRSGTSLVARVLNLLGLDLGPQEHLMGPSGANPGGHWESVPITEINDEILSRLGGDWSQPPHFGAGWQHKRELADLRQRARELIQADFPGSDPWGFKDPRTSLTLPFWQHILPPMRYVICLRNPVDVAASLEARKEDWVPFERGVRLWLAYVRAALGATAGYPREMVFYEDLMADPDGVVDRLARFVGVVGADDVGAEARAAIRVAVTDELWHHRSVVTNVIDTPALPFYVKGFYLALRQVVPGREEIGPELLDVLGQYAEDTARYIGGLEDSKAELGKTRDLLKALERERDALERGRDALERERDALERRLSERIVELERVTKARDEERRARRELEGKLGAARAEPRQPEESSEGTGAAEARPDDGGASAGYRRLVDEVRERAIEAIPAGASVAVASKGDDALLRLEDRSGVHFPVGPGGGYAGYHPAGDTAAIAQLEALRAQGIDHLLLPATALWWLEHYRGFHRHLEERYVPVFRDERCVIYRLRGPETKRTSAPLSTIRRVTATLRVRSGRDPSVLDWRTGMVIAEQLPEMPVFVPPAEGATLPYLSGTIDVVVVPSADPGLVEEARRVASRAVIKVDPAKAEPGEVEWRAGGADGWGHDLNVTLLPDAASAEWKAAAEALADSMDEGFSGELTVLGERSSLEAAMERVNACGASAKTVETRPGSSLSERARAALDAGDHRIHVFVAAPAVPLPGWLPSIVELFSSGRDAGVVGGRILSRYGTLEEAGGIVTPDGSRQRRGEGDQDPDRPDYRFLRRVDFCSPPLLATSRPVFERLGGFGDRAVPAEALVDYSLRAGQAGNAVYYQPEARVVAIGNGR